MTIRMKLAYIAAVGHLFDICTKILRPPLLLLLLLLLLKLLLLLVDAATMRLLCWITRVLLLVDQARVFDCKPRNCSRIRSHLGRNLLRKVS